MNFRNTIDVEKALRLSTLNLGNQRAAVKARLEELRDDPYRLNQIAGCCGFNVIITLLLIHGDTEVFANFLRLIWGSQLKHENIGLKGFEPGRVRIAYLSLNENRHPIRRRIQTIRDWQQTPHSGCIWYAMRTLRDCQPSRVRIAYLSLNENRPPLFAGVFKRFEIGNKLRIPDAFGKRCVPYVIVSPVGYASRTFR